MTNTKSCGYRRDAQLGPAGLHCECCRPFRSKAVTRAWLNRRARRAGRQAGWGHDEQCDDETILDPNVELDLESSLLLEQEAIAEDYDFAREYAEHTEDDYFDYRYDTPKY